MSNNPAGTSLSRISSRSGLTGGVGSSYANNDTMSGQSLLSGSVGAVGSSNVAPNTAAASHVGLSKAKTVSQSTRAWPRIKCRQHRRRDVAGHPESQSAGEQVGKPEIVRERVVGPFRWWGSPAAQGRAADESGQAQTPAPQVKPPPGLAARVEPTSAMSGRKNLRAIRSDPRGSSPQRWFFPGRFLFPSLCRKLKSL